MKEIVKRSQVREEDTWKLEDIYATENAWEEDFQRAEKEMEQASEWMGTIGTDADRMKAALDWNYRLAMRLRKLMVYSHQKLDQDTSDSHSQDLAMRVKGLAVKANAKLSFLEPEILQTGEEMLRRMLDESEELRFYQRVIEEMLRRNAHTLGQKEESILALAGDVTDAASTAYQMVNNADLKFPPVFDARKRELPVTHGTFVPLQENPDRAVRKASFESMYGTYRQFQNLFASLFYSNIRQDLFYARARKYPSTRAYHLDGPNVPEIVYDQLIDTVHKNIHLMHRYVALRKKILGVDQLHMYDVYVPLVQEYTKQYSFEEAKSIVKEGLKPLGEEYVSHLQEGFDNRWIDVYENEGKRSGAYSWGCYESHPYVLLNYKGTLDHVFTLAHEMGHALHSYYSNSAQPYVYSGYRIFVAEVASTCNEALLIRDMLAKSTDQTEKKALINHFLESFKGTLYRQTMFAEFERICHRKVEGGETLTAETLNRTYRELNQFYFGEEMVSDEEIALEWARIPHFYTPFYVYQYATGFSAAIALSSQILEEGDKAVEAYKRFLKTGGSMDPIDELKVAGVDMTSPEPVQKALDLFETLLDEMEALC